MTTTLCDSGRSARMSIASSMRRVVLPVPRSSQPTNVPHQHQTSLHVSEMVPTYRARFVDGVDPFLSSSRKTQQLTICPVHGPIQQDDPEDLLCSILSSKRPLGIVWMDVAPCRIVCTDSVFCWRPETRHPDKNEITRMRILHPVVQALITSNHPQRRVPKQLSGLYEDFSFAHFAAPPTSSEA